MRISDWSSDVCSSDLKGLVDPSSCPLEGHIDVALLVRPRIAPRPTAVEDGVTCALRAGVPLVEQGSEVLDPYGPWVALRTHTDADSVADCEEAITPGRSEGRRLGTECVSRRGSRW